MRGTAASTTSLERGFQWLVGRYTRGLDFVLRHQRTTLLIFIVTVAATVVLYVFVPKGFFPQQDTGIISGLTDAPAGRLVRLEMVRLQKRLTDVVGKDPGRRQLGRIRRRRAAAEHRLRRHRPEAARRSATPARTRSSTGCARSSPQVPGGTLFLQAAQDLNVGGRLTRTQYQYTLQDPNLDELNSGRRSCWRS